MSPFNFSLIVFLVFLVLFFIVLIIFFYLRSRKQKKSKNLTKSHLVPIKNKFFEEKGKKIKLDELLNISVNRKRAFFLRFFDRFRNFVFGFFESIFKRKNKSVRRHIKLKHGEKVNYKPEKVVKGFLARFYDWMSVRRKEKEQKKNSVDNLKNLKEKAQIKEEKKVQVGQVKSFLQRFNEWKNQSRKSVLNVEKGLVKAEKEIIKDVNVFEKKIEKGIVSDLGVKHKTSEKILRITAILIPVVILLVLLYVNFLPFGYESSYVIEVGKESDTSGNFYLEQSSGLGTRQKIDGEYFRKIDGLVYAVYKPKVILSDALVSVKLDGDGVSFKKPLEVEELDWDYNFAENGFIDFKVNNPSSVYNQFVSGEEKMSSIISLARPFAILINFKAGINEQLLDGGLVLIQNTKYISLTYQGKSINYNVSDYFLDLEHEILVGYSGSEIYLFVDKEFAGKNSINESLGRISSKIPVKLYSNYDFVIREMLEKDENDCLIFDGNQRIVYPHTAHLFEEGAFGVFVKWIPNLKANGQQIVGHYNWEIWQNEKNVEFRVGRMDNEKGPSYSISYPVSDSFFGKEHEIFAFYNPFSFNGEQGYIEMYVDGKYAGRKNFAKHEIWTEYGREDLSMGWTPHNYRKSPYFNGKICDLKFSSDAFSGYYYDSLEFRTSDDIVKIPIYGNGKLQKVELQIKK